MLNKIIFILGHLVVRPKVVFFYFKLKKNECCNEEDLKSELAKKVNVFIAFCNNNIPFYRSKLNVKTQNTIGDKTFCLNSIPLLHKLDIIKNKALLEVNSTEVGKYKVSQTGGSTGDPLRFRISNVCDDMGLAILYRGLSRGGYKLGDKIAVMAGGSLISKELSWKTKLINKVMNVRKYSSYGVNNELLFDYFTDIDEWAPKFLRGYPSAIFEFAKFVEENKLKLTFESVYTTAEMLSLQNRRYIEKVFKTTIFDCYGLNDGGVTAFECKNHDGYHIDMERGYLEVVNESGEQVFDEEGRIVATSFLNYATPFVRYITGDLGVMSKESCSCGLPFPILKGLRGRVTDSLRINGCLIGSPVLTVLMSHSNALRYQFVQRSSSLLDIIMETNERYSSKLEEGLIRSSLESQVGKFEINFIYDTAHFIQTDGGKHKIVVNKSKSA